MQDFEIPSSKRRHGVKYVCARYGRDGKSINPATLYRWLSAQRFPQPDRINGVNSWTEATLDAYDDQMRREAEAVAA